jgi:D-lactate dehydrogenase
MHIKLYSSRQYEKPFLETSNHNKHVLSFEPALLNEETASLAKGYEAVSVFTNDDVNAQVLELLREAGVKHIAIRAAGYNNVDLKKAASLGISVANVPEYSPYSVAEHTVSLILALNRQLSATRQRVAGYDFTLDGLEGFDINGKTLGIIGLGKIGGIVAKIMHGFGCTIKAFDLNPDPHYTKAYGVKYCSLSELYAQSDILSLHAPLNEATHHLINKASIAEMKKGVMIVNSGRGGLIDTKAAIDGLKSGQIGYLGIDVYEFEKGIFFNDHSASGIDDPVLKELLTLPNVLVTPHMGFLTETALRNIADTTIDSIDRWSEGEKSKTTLV